MSVFRNATLALAWFWGGFVLLTEGAPGFVRLGESLGYGAAQIIMAFAYTIIFAVGGACVLLVKGLK